MLDLLKPAPHPMTETECAEVGYLVRACDLCQIDAGLPTRDCGHDTWYYCPVCHTQWIVDDGREWGTILAGLVFLAYFVAITLCGMLGVALLARDVWHLDHGAFAVVTVLGGMSLGLVASILITSIINGLHRLSLDAFDYVWGPPLAWFETRGWRA